MYEITYLVFIRYRGPFGMTILLPKLRTAHVDRRLHALRRFSLEDELGFGGNGPLLTARR